MSAPLSLKDDEALRLRCLELALSQGHGDPVIDAGKFVDFITGEPAKTPRQLIDAALEAANVR
jgi:hypothetical protein